MRIYPTCGREFHDEERVCDFDGHTLRRLRCDVCGELIYRDDMDNLHEVDGVLYCPDCWDDFLLESNIIGEDAYEKHVEIEDESDHADARYEEWRDFLNER